MKINYIFSALALVAIMLTSSFAIAQNNEGFSYQSIIRDTDGLPIDNQNVSIRVGIYEGSTSGPLVYQETHTVTTSDVGLISLIISEGTVVSGDFSVIDWGNASHFVTTETDPSGGTNYTLVGSSRLLSVPYAKYASVSGSSNSMSSDWTLQGNTIDEAIDLSLIHI